MRNKLAGKHPSYDKLGMSEERRKKKLAYDKAYHQSEDRKNYRVELNKKNREQGMVKIKNQLRNDTMHMY